MKLTSDKFLSLKEESRLFKAIATAADAGDRAAKVDHMLFALLALSGLRISEALNLTWDDVGEDYLLLAQTKSGVKQTVHIGNKLISMLESFRESNPYKSTFRNGTAAATKHLFNTQKGPMGRTSAHDRLKHWLNVAKLRSSITCHSFRHTYATRCLDAGLPLPVVRDQLRHSSISVTSVYLHFSEETKEKLKEVF
jgi:integrase/recombinase XerD